MSIKHILTWTIALSAILISACSPSVGGKGEIQFKEIFESRTSSNHIEVVDTYELDVDDDTYKEWVVLYRFDPTQGSGEWNNTPVQGMVYDAIACDPPLLYNWYLPIPDNDFLSEGSITAETEDLLDGNNNVSTNELVINGPGPVNTWSIYSFRHNQKNGCQKPSHETEGFSLLGFFRSNGPIQPEKEGDEPLKVTTYQRSSYERSQLAIRSTYIAYSDTAKHQETFLVNGRLKSPDEQTIDFLYGQPESPQDSPYPEKAVAAFYLSVGQDNARASSFLYGDPDEATFTSAPGWGLDLRPDQIDHVLIYSISYTPDVAKERAHQRREVKAVIKPIGTDGKALAPRTVTLEVLGVPIDGSETDCEWRLKEITDVQVTNGLGMLMN